MSSANKWMWVWHTYTQYSAYKEQHNSHVFGDFIRSTFAVQMSRFFAWCAFFAGFNRLPANNNIVVGWQHFFALSIILLISIAETLNRLIGFDCLMLIKTQTEALRAHSSSISLNWYSWAVPICHSYSKFNLETDFSICAHCCLLNWKNKSGFKLIEYVKLCVCVRNYFFLSRRFVFRLHIAQSNAFNRMQFVMPSQFSRFQNFLNKFTKFRWIILFLEFCINLFGLLPTDS